MGPFSCVFLTVVQIGLISKSFKSGMKYLLNDEPSPKTED